MKIKIESGQDKPFLDNGRHVVTITDVSEGTSEHKGVPFFTCRYENEDGFVTSRYYTSEPGLPAIIDLFRTVGIEIKEGKEINTKDLLNKSLSVEVMDRTYNDPSSGKEKTIKEAVNFEPAGKAATSSQGRVN